MLTIRIGLASGSEAPPVLLHEVANAVRSHPLTDAMRGTVILGLGAPNAVRQQDIRPRVVAPAAWPQRLGAIARAQLAYADVIVALDPAEHANLTSAMPTPPRPVVTSTGFGDSCGYLPTATAYDAIEAITVISEHPDLCTSLPDLRPGAVRSATDSAAQAIIEALVLGGGASE